MRFIFLIGLYHLDNGHFKEYDGRMLDVQKMMVIFLNGKDISFFDKCSRLIGDV